MPDPCDRPAVAARPIPTTGSSKSRSEAIPTGSTTAASSVPQRLRNQSGLQRWFDAGCRTWPTCGRPWRR